MVVKGDQQRIRALIKDTLTLLCKNGLSFDTQFSMEALIVFTLDDEEVFHVSINETVKNQLAKAQSIAENESNDDSFVEDSSPHFPSDRDSSQHKTGSSDTNRRQNRKRTLSGVKQELSEQGAGDENGGQWPADDSWNQKSPPDPDLSPATYDESSFQSQGSSTEPPNAKRRNVHSSSNNDIIIIKEEMDDSASEQNVCYNTQAPYGDIDLAQALGSDSLGAGPSQSSAQNMWADPSQHQNMSRTSTITSEGGDMSQMSQTADVGTLLAAQGRRALWCQPCQKQLLTPSGYADHMRQHLGIYRYHCPYCNKGFSSTSNMRGHLAKHTGVREFSCTFCGKQYLYKHHLKMHLQEKHLAVAPDSLITNRGEKHVGSFSARTDGGQSGEHATESLSGKTDEKQFGEHVTESFIELPAERDLMGQNSDEISSKSGEQLETREYKEATTTKIDYLS